MVKKESVPFYGRSDVHESIFTTHRRFKVPPLYPKDSVLQFSRVAELARVERLWTRAEFILICKESRPKDFKSRIQRMYNGKMKGF